jgi:hypothetical protein
MKRPRANASCKGTKGKKSVRTQGSRWIYLQPPLAVRFLGMTAARKTANRPYLIFGLQAFPTEFVLYMFKI